MASEINSVFDKVLRVIDSCITDEQLESATNYAVHFMNIYFQGEECPKSMEVVINDRLFDKFCEINLYP